MKDVFADTRLRARTLILISGKAQHGKDTAGEYLETRWGFRRFAFADALKEIARTAFRWDGCKDTPGRILLQEMGSCARHYDPDFWPKRLAEQIRECGLPERVVITDWRFKNEEGAIARLLPEYSCVLTLRVNRPDFDNGLSEEAKVHVSETELDNHPVDCRLTNRTGDFEILYKELEGVMRRCRMTCDMPSWNTGIMQSEQVRHPIPRIRETDFLSGKEFPKLSSDKPLLTFDFDDTLLEKTGTFPRRVAAFRHLCSDADVVIVTARQGAVQEIESFLKKHRFPETVKGIIYQAGDKRKVLTLLSPMLHFDDDAEVACKLVPDGIPVVLMGEFASVVYLNRWTEAVKDELKLYTARYGSERQLLDKKLLKVPDRNDILELCAISFRMEKDRDGNDGSSNRTGKNFEECLQQAVQIQR